MFLPAKASARFPARAVPTFYKGVEGAIQVDVGHPTRVCRAAYRCVESVRKRGYVPRRVLLCSQTLAALIPAFCLKFNVCSVRPNAFLCFVVLLCAVICVLGAFRCMSACFVMFLCMSAWLFHVSLIVGALT